MQLEMWELEMYSRSSDFNRPNERRQNQMSITDVLDKAEFLIDDKGNKKAVVLDMALWQELLDLLQDVEDANEIQRLRELGDETVDWTQAKSDLRAKGIDV